MAWATMPVGIPTPPAILGQTRDETYGAGFYTYWVNNLTGNDGTAGNGGKGTEAAPRATIPTSLVAGDVVEIRGGPYTGTGLTWSGNGTAVAPIIIRGPSYAERVTISRVPQVGGNYMIVENIKFNPALISDGTRLASYAVLRYCEFAGSGANEGGGTTIGPSDSQHDVIVHNCSIHDWGEWQATTQNDQHGLSAGNTSGQYNMWYLWNTLYHLGGDGIGNAHDADHAPHDLFIGGNTSYDCRENAVDLKEVHDIVISENHFYSWVESPGGSSVGAPGEAIVIHYGPDTGQGPYNCWILNNHVHDAVYGVAYSGAQSANYVIGNVFHDCGTGINPSRGGGNYYVYHNTCYNCPIGISQDSSSSIDSLEVHGNIVSQASSRHLEVYSSTVATNTNASHECYYQGGGNVFIAWGDDSVNYSTVAAWISGTSDGDNSIQQNPLFVNPGANNFALQESSPCRSAGYNMLSIAATFAANWSTSLLKDIAGTSRPNGVWDMGAYQYGTTTPPTGTPVLSVR